MKLFRSISKTPRNVMNIKTTLCILNWTILQHYTHNITEPLVAWDKVITLFPSRLACLYAYPRDNSSDTHCRGIFRWRQNSNCINIINTKHCKFQYLLESLPSQFFSTVTILVLYICMYLYIYMVCQTVITNWHSISWNTILTLR